MFYATPQLHVRASRIPAVIYSHASATLGEFVLLLEDITASVDVTPANFVFGNQVWGVPQLKMHHDPVDVLKVDII